MHRTHTHPLYTPAHKKHSPFMLRVTRLFSCDQKCLYSSVSSSLLRVSWSPILQRVLDSVSSLLRHRGQRDAEDAK